MGSAANAQRPLIKKTKNKDDAWKRVSNARQREAVLSALLGGPIVRIVLCSNQVEWKPN